uniref:Neurogenic locus Notch protein n=1 Tax=Panagrellus redivivus TaxID=6233 RepID=A0A7E4UU52_PANRE
MKHLRLAAVLLVLIVSSSLRFGSGLTTPCPPDGCAGLPPAVPCLNGGSPTTTGCKCPRGFGGENCAQLRPCQQPEYEHFCENGGTCSDSKMTISCHCVPGYSGDRCEKNSDDCKANKCHPEAKCVDILRGYKCECPPHRIGQFCQFENPCFNVPKPCNDGICVPLPHTGSFKCSCTSFFTGPDCSTDINECASAINPCQHGKCINTYGGFHCECKRGYTGELCDRYSNECAPNPCLNGGSCMDLLGNFQCQCKPGWTGKRCDEVKPFSPGCRSRICLAGGVCQRDPSTGAESCVCQPRFTGETCDTPREDPCLMDLCRNGAQCLPSSNLRSVSCQCPPGFAGHYCDRKVTSCSDVPCDRGTCIDTADGFQCVCDAGFDGPLCSNNIDDCSESSCLNGGICIDGINSYTCACPSTYFGRRCELNVTDPCQFNPCSNGASCLMIDVRGNFRCMCPPGFTGRFCEAASEGRCTLNSCLHNGICALNGLCKCAPGYSGKRCEHETNRCLRERCQNGGTCENIGLTDFTCHCQFGFVGRHCAEKVDVDRFADKAAQETQTCNVAGCALRAGNGICDAECNLPGCDYDGGDCSAAIPRPFEQCPYEKYCKYVFRDGHCDAACNTENCLFDGFDCDHSTDVCPASLACENRFGNGICDPECNLPGCGFDGGDCADKAPFLDDLVLDLDVDEQRFVNELLPSFLMRVSSYLRASVSFRKDEKGRLQIYRLNPETGKTTLIDIGSVGNGRVARQTNPNLVRVHLQVDVSGCQFESELSRALNVSLTTDSKPHCLSGVTAATNLIATDAAQDLFSTLGVRVKRALAEPYQAPTPSNPFQIAFAIIIGIAVLLAIIIGVVTVSNAYRGKRRYVDVTHVYHPPSRDNKTPLLPTTPNQFTMTRQYSLSPGSPEDLYEGGTSSSNSGGTEPKRPRLAASSSGDEGIVRDMVDPTPFVAPTRDRFFTRLHERVAYNNRGLIGGKWPDELKVCLKLRDNVGRNALHWAADCVADKNESDIMADVMDLIAAGESTSCRDDSGVTPLQIAIRRGRPQVARYLMDPRSVSTMDNEGRTPLYDAVCAGLPCIVEELLTMYQVNPNVMFDGWDTPLHKAVRLGQRGLPIVDSLLQCPNIDVDRTGERQDLGYRGVTALHLAAEFGNAEAVQKLLNKGANIGACDLYNETPLHYAIHNEQLAAVHVLVAWGGESVIHTVSDFDQNCEALARVKGNGFIISTIQGARGSGRVFPLAPLEKVKSRAKKARS